MKKRQYTKEIKLVMVYSDGEGIEGAQIVEAKRTKVKRSPFLSLRLKSLNP